MRSSSKFALLLLLAQPAWAASPTTVGRPFAGDPACAAGEYWLAVNSSSTAWRRCTNGTITDLDTGGGGGEVNTASNLGGGLANWDSKNVFDLRFNSFSATDFDLAANLLTIDATLTRDAEAAAAYVPLARTVSTTAPLSGGGDLSANRTITTSMNTNRLIGRGTAAVGVMEEITLGTNLSFTGTTLNAAGGGGTPASPSTSVQFEDAGAFGGDAQFLWNKTTNTLTVGDGSVQGFLDVKCPTPASMNCETTYVEDTAFGGTPAAGLRKLQARATGFFEIDSAAVTRRLLAGGTVDATVDFGTAGNFDASVVVTSQVSVTATSQIICNPTMMVTADRPDGSDDALLDELTALVYARSAGVGFTVKAHAPNRAFGKFIVQCVWSG